MLRGGVRRFEGQHELDGEREGWGLVCVIESFKCGVDEKLGSKRGTEAT